MADGAGLARRWRATAPAATARRTGVPGVPARLPAGRVGRLAPDPWRVGPRARAARSRIGGSAASGAMPGERFAGPRAPTRRSSPATSPTAGRWSGPACGRTAETRAREARELDRQKAWRDQAARALNALKAEEGTGPVNADELETTSLDRAAARRRGRRRDGETVLVPGGSPLPTLRVLPQGISRKRLEQAIRDLQLPVVIARDVDEADVVMTLRNEYKQKTPLLRDAEDRAMPIYVLKSNTIPQMQSSLTSIFSLEIDPREAALRETEDAIGVGPVVVRGGRAVAAERLHPAAPAPDGRAGQPRLAVARPRAVPPRAAVPGRRPQRAGGDRAAVARLHRPLDGRRRPRWGPPPDRPGHARPGRPTAPGRTGPRPQACCTASTPSSSRISTGTTSTCRRCEHPRARHADRRAGGRRALAARHRLRRRPRASPGERLDIGPASRRAACRRVHSGLPARRWARRAAAIGYVRPREPDRCTSPATPTCSRGWPTWPGPSTSRCSRSGAGVRRSAAVCTSIRTGRPRRSASSSRGRPCRSTGARTGRTRSGGSTPNGWSTRRRRSPSTPRSSPRTCVRSRPRSATAWQLPTMTTGTGSERSLGPAAGGLRSTLAPGCIAYGLHRPGRRRRSGWSALRLDQRADRRRGRARLGDDRCELIATLDTTANDARPIASTTAGLRSRARSSGPRRRVDQAADRSSAVQPQLADARGAVPLDQHPRASAARRARRTRSSEIADRARRASTRELDQVGRARLVGQPVVARASEAAIRSALGDAIAAAGRSTADRRVEDGSPTCRPSSRSLMLVLRCMDGRPGDRRARSSGSGCAASSAARTDGLSAQVVA